MKRRTATAALCAALLITAMTTGAAVASGPHEGLNEGPPPREAAALTGSAELYRSAGDDITFTDGVGALGEGQEEVRKGTGDFEVVPWLPRP
ncbi:hypothetical protein [Streptomyces sp. AC512_CC834]|uniref:hypothetical protein n=1 Tax=Streptomyces sp. AC512_CC834 TaxID=2823691 RepID=UPI0020B6FC7B|nr:hypothetical protein [Streptomyces sp. AC512_CC834]